MKIVRTVIVFDRGDMAHSEGWATTYSTYSGVIAAMVNPVGSDLNGSYLSTFLDRAARA